MMDGGWLSHQGSYAFHAPDFPDPKGLFDRVNAQGWIPLIWTAHFVSPDSREYKRLRYHPKSGGLDYLALRKAGVRSALHGYPDGGHGYGQRRMDKAIDHWNDVAAEWLKTFVK